MSVASRVAGPQLYRASKPLRDRKLLAWVRSLPCAVCGWRGVESAHTGPHGIGQKASDDTAIPLCRRDHRTGPRSLHLLGPVEFERVHGLDIAALRERLQRDWKMLCERRVA